MSSRAQLQTKSVNQLRAFAQGLGIDTEGLQKAKLISALIDAGFSIPADGDGGRSSSQDIIDESISLPHAKLRSAEAPKPVGGHQTSANSRRRGTITAPPPSSDQTTYSTIDSPSAEVISQSRSRLSGDGRTGGGRDRTMDRHSRGRRGDRRRRGEPVPEAELTEAEGLLDIMSDKFAFIRVNGYLASDRDVYVSIGQIRKFKLRKGDHIKGKARPPRSKEKYAALVRVDSVNDQPVDQIGDRIRFEKLTPLFPNERLKLEVIGKKQILTRIIDLIAPIGKGQRGLIVSPPKAGKTTVLKEIAQAITVNNPECHMMVVLVDERPEEVTDMQRSVEGEIIYSTFDRPADDHTQVADLAIERAKRLVETGKDVVVVLDSITRLARAHNLAAPTSGRVMSGGVDSTALYPPKRFFGAARNIEEGGSLTILATALVETGSRMDEVIFEEFKGTGNMELRLDRKLADRRIYPAVDIPGSGTRKEELLFEKQELEQVWRLRRALLDLEQGAGLEMMIDRLGKFKDNASFLVEVARST